jgi:hypothetical protein
MKMTKGSETYKASFRLGEIAIDVTSHALAEVIAKPDKNKWSSFCKRKGHDLCTGKRHAPRSSTKPCECPCHKDCNKAVPS